MRQSSPPLAKGVRDSLNALGDAVRASKLAEAEEELAQAALRKQFESNYLNGRGAVGRAIAERLFPKATRGPNDADSSAPIAPK